MIIVAGALAVAIALPAGAAVASRTVTVGSPANGKTVELKKGDTLVVRLAANPTTGYDWAVVSKPRALKLVKSTFLAPHSQAIGQGGTDVFRF
jgi:predicted secreted protein